MMALTKCKICPSCGSKNPVSFIECQECEADLTGVKVTDESKQITEHNAQSAPQTIERMVRICSECSSENPPQARKCKNCGEDISDILPFIISGDAVACDECASKQEYRIIAIDDEVSFCIESKELIIGRTAELSEYLGNKMYVSRQHARITYDDGKLYIENLSETNHTFVNQEDIGTGKRFELKTGDEIGLGGKLHNGSRQNQAAYFVVQYKQ